MNILNLNQLQFYNLMKEQTENLASSSEWLEVLRGKYRQMGILELRKEKIVMVKDLQEINRLLDEMIEGQTKGEPKSIEDVVMEIQQNKRMQRNLRRTLDNFQFMLTGDYSVKADQEIQRLNNQVKVMREEVGKFGRMLSVPMQKDIQICEDLQKQVYRLEKDVEQIKVKNHKKKEYIAQMTEQNGKKLQGIKKISKQIGKLLEENDAEELMKNQTSKQDKESYEQLLSKKDKLLHIIEKDQKRLSKEYKNKLKKHFEVQEASIEIQQYLREVQKGLEEKNDELGRAKERKRSAIKRQRNSEPNSLAKIKIKSSESSQIENMIRYNQKRPNILRETKDQLPQALTAKTKTPTAASTSSNLLPRLYKALGKAKLQIEQDCDIKDLLY